ncbi:MAG: DAK2 domain-containing protein [Nanoarchaeota archaeon]|nr:DAK2 domain-containing protein [Nanoarchaeota archaeon]
MERLEVNDFKNMIFETASVIESKKDYLNYINVFPVRDGDTGNNLCYTFNNAKNLKNHDSLKDFLIDLKTYLLSDARGNSGVIMSQFYKGFCDCLIKYKKVGPEEFAKAIKIGCNYAYKAVNNPVEGTMLTVFKGASIGAIKMVKKCENVIDVLLSSFETAQKYLKKTMNRLPVLKDCGVVDAGGLGVIYMMAAWLRAIGVVPKYDSSFDHMIVKEPVNNIKMEYCVNVLLKKCEHVKGLKEVLGSIGDSIELGEDNNLLRIHMHTNDFDNVKILCSSFGEIVKFEVDNMREQNESIRKD